MPLSNDLLSQFAKATTSIKKVESETTVYGTVVKYEDCYYVRLDGSDRLTPMDSVTTAQEGDRVSVRIKNHSAAITGNISSPAANVGKVEEIEGKTKVYIDKLLAGYVSTEYLEANYASIAKLNAIEANIETLTADNVTINEKLTAKEAVIEKLQADVADIKILDADYAKISDLDAINADINNLEANYGNINNLIFGSASGTTIQTSFANSVIAQLGDAQIKSAMIEEVSADKIAAGDIITNNVRVMSEDGSLLIADETIQISDETKVRVQIGKDTEGDYNIYIWDVDGHLMFDATGITEEAVKKAIIRNDMVKDDANISASKLDIDSLFTEINGSTNTIKSTKVYLDEEGQTLDVSFKKMTSDVSELDSSVKSQGTQLSVIQGQIESKIWEQDITTAIDGISVGGRNYFAKSKAVGHRYEVRSDTEIYTNTRTSAWLNFFVFPVSEGEKWTLYRCSADSSEWGLALYQDTDSIVMNTGTFVFYDPEQAPNVVNNFTIPSGITLAAIIFGENYEFTSPEEIPNIMLEKGDKASDWSLAPEDIEGSITTIFDKYNTVQNTVDGLSVTVGEHATQLENKADKNDVTAVSNKVANLEISVNSIDASVSEFKTYTADSLEVSGRNLIVRRGELTDTYVLADGSVIESETNYKSATMVDTIRIVAGETYTFSKDESAANYYFRWAWYDKDGNVLGRSADNASVFSWTAPENATHIRVSYPYVDGAKPKLEKGAEATEYCPALEDVGITLVNDYVTTVAMDAAIKVESDNITSSVKETVSREIDDLEIGGCNLIKNSDFSNGTRLWVHVGVTTSIELDDTYGTCLKITSTDVGSSSQRIYPSTTENFIHKPDADGTPGRYSLSFYAKTDSEATLQTNIAGGTAGVKNYTLSTEWQRFTHTYDASAGSITFWLNEAGATAYITRVQMERGDKVTDWTPASDEITTNADLDNATADLNNTIDGITERVVANESRIQQLSNAISMLVVNENGESLMMQDGDSWYFNTANIQGALDDTAKNLDELLEEFGSLDAVVEELNNRVDDIGGLAEYVRIGTYEYVDEEGVTQTVPSIELGESDSEFKQRVTNTKSIFLDGINAKTSVSKDGILTENIEVTNELKTSGLVEVTDDGDDTYISKVNYIWKVRKNGNFGLIYDGWLG